MFFWVKEVWSLFGSFFMRYPETSWPNIPWPSQTPRK
jgi:hypothetical protein